MQYHRIGRGNALDLHHACYVNVQSKWKTPLSRRFLQAMSSVSNVLMSSDIRLAECLDLTLERLERHAAAEHVLVAVHIIHARHR